MFKIVIMLLSLLSINAYAQDDNSTKHYQFGMEVQQIEVAGMDKTKASHIDSESFIDNYKDTLKTSKIYRYLMSLLQSSPNVYHALINTVWLNENQRMMQKVDELIKTQKRTNELLNKFLIEVDVSKININGDGTARQLADGLRG